MRITLQIKGLDKLVAKLLAAPRIVSEARVPALMQAARPVADRARELAPVAHGDLAQSIHVERRGVAAGVVTRDEAALHVEYGTHHMAAQPFLRPAMDGAGRDALKEAGETVGEVLENRLRE